MFRTRYRLTYLVDEPNLWVASVSYPEYVVHTPFAKCSITCSYFFRFELRSRWYNTRQNLTGCRGQWSIFSASCTLPKRWFKRFEEVMAEFKSRACLSPDAPLFLC